MPSQPRDGARRAIAKELNRLHRKHQADRARDEIDLRRLMERLGEMQLDRHFN
jgi:hypothetical protein